MSSAVTFRIPPGCEATEPPERRGVPRDGVRLLVAGPDGLASRTFRDLPELLAPGDLVVLNTSATLPAAVDTARGPVHVSTVLDDGTWVIEPRLADGSGPDRAVRRDDELGLPGGVALHLLEPYPDPSARAPRLWRGRVAPAVPVEPYLARHGRPVGYGYLAGRFPLADSQTVYATQPGSAEMASAGRPFTADLLVRLVARGVAVAPVVLHAGVSSPDGGEPPLPERFAVPAATARLIGSARAAGARVVAVGTTVVRALESAVAPDGSVGARAGWTSLVLGPDRPPRVVDGLVTGLHAPEASHLLLLEAVAGAALVGAAYEAAVRERYLWHEFGDSMLFLPARPGPRHQEWEGRRRGTTAT